MSTVNLPRSLLALFPGATRRHEVGSGTVASIIDELDASIPGLRARLVQEGPSLRPHINVFVDGEPGDLETPVGGTSVVHVIPAVSGGSTEPLSVETVPGPDGTAIGMNVHRRRPDPTVAVQIGNVHEACVRMAVLTGPAKPAIASELPGAGRLPRAVRVCCSSTYELRSSTTR